MEALNILKPRSDSMSDLTQLVPPHAAEERIVVLGGASLRGEIPVSGSKNGSLPILAASLLASKGQCVLRNVPDISDVRTMCAMLRALGARVMREDDAIIVDAQDLHEHRAPSELVREMRASFYVAAPLLARLRNADVPLPGGCVLGPRPVNYHIDAFTRMGARIQVEHGSMIADAPKWVGAHIYLEPRNSSVGATVNIMMAACLAEGTTTIENAAREPEVLNLADFLNRMGGKVTGAGTATIVIEGVEALHGAEAEVYCDRIEAGTYLALAGVPGSDITITGLPATHLPVYLDKLRAAGLDVEAEDKRIRARYTGALHATDLSTAPFPGLATDLQPLFMTLMCRAEGRSVIEENLYDGRFNYVPELVRMGADIELVNSTAIVRGVKKLSGAEVQSTDLRAGAALVLAGLAAEGRTEVTNVKYIDRGYENFVPKLRSLGGQVVRQSKAE